MGLPRCPKCGCLLQVRADEDPYIDRYDNNEGIHPNEWIDKRSPWLGLLSFVSWLAFRLMPWVKRHRWCPRCHMTVV
jgi:hypothetical protein